MYLGISQLEHEVTSYPAVWAVSRIQTTINYVHQNIYQMTQAAQVAGTSILATPFQ